MADDFRWMLKEDASLKRTKRWKTITYFHFKIIRVLPLALWTYAIRTSVYLTCDTLFIWESDTFLVKASLHYYTVLMRRHI